LVAFFSKIQSSGNRLVALLNDLLDLSKLEANKIIINYQSVSLNSLTTGIIDELSILLDEKNMSANIQDKIDYKVECDPVIIRQVIVNLLSNAIKFSDNDSSIEISIESGMIENVPATTFNVKDEGMGIPAGEESQVFDKFIQSSKTITGAGGTGLGLAICKEIIMLHGGNISVCNNNEAGATFSFTIPNSFTIPKNKPV
jgi:signal transduction histidine kinase